MTSAFARYPSPITRIPGSSAAGELYVKDDGRLREDYGGNKVRKLEGILPRLAAEGARRVLTVGPAGSHHVLATTLLGRELGLRTAAVLFPQPGTEHARRTLAAALEAGLEAIPIASKIELPFALLRARRPGDALLPPGASTPAGAAGYARAVVELEAQVARGELPPPDLIVVAAGSGGTAAGLLAGLALSSLATRLVAVDVGAAGQLAGPLIVGLAAEVLRREGHPLAVGRLRGRLRVERRYAGEGYGRALPGFTEVAGLATALGLAIEGTYTGKALAAALDLVREPAARGAEISPQRRSRLPLRVLYWHTLSKGIPRALDPEPLPEDLDHLFALSV